MEHDSERAEIFEFELFAKIINGARGVVKWGAMRGGQQTDVTSDQVEVAIKPEGVVVNKQAGSTREIGLGDIVNIQAESRTVDEAKRNVIKVDHMVEKKRITSYVSLINPRIQHLLNRYMRKEYAQLRDEISTTDISETETQLIIGYYTTQDIRETMQTLTGGDKHEFEAVYEQALDHGLVSHPDDGIGLTQKGRMLANVEIESVNQ
jgi:helix-turn-helix protein